MKNRDGGEVNDHWGTPKWLFDKLDKEFHFDFDPCPLRAKFDGLSESRKWGKSNFINPPYNRHDKPKFIRRAYNEWKLNRATCVLLIPAATGTKDFHELIYPHAEIRFLKGRVAFCGTNTKGEYSETNKGKHDSMIVIFKGEPVNIINRIPCGKLDYCSWSGNKSLLQETYKLGCPDGTRGDCHYPKPAHDKGKETK